MYRKLLVFQHTPWEKPGKHLLRAATTRRVHLDVWEAWHQPAPDIAYYDGLIVLGGTPNVDEEGRYPFLKVEKTLSPEPSRGIHPISVSVWAISYWRTSWVHGWDQIFLPVLALFKGN